MKFFYTTILSIFNFYRDGFRNMSDWGKRSWIILIIKLFIIFFVLRLFFFPDFLGKRFNDDSDRSNYVRNQILNIK
jgi:hypothetical protein